MEFNYDTFNQAVIGLSWYILKYGKEVRVERKDVTDNTVFEINPCLINIEKPQYRSLLINSRGENPFAALYETLWVMSGDNRIETLKHFIPRAADFSDDGGETWRAAYGKRVFNYGPKGIDQIKNVYEVLKKDITSRRAIVSLWCPEEEAFLEHARDYPCNSILQFLVRDNKLNLYVYVRSNDLLWGFSAINFVEWSYVQEFLSILLGIEVGPIHWFTSNMHYYNKFKSRIEKLSTNQYCKIIDGSYTQEFNVTFKPIVAEGYDKSLIEIKALTADVTVFARTASSAVSVEEKRSMYDALMKSHNHDHSLILFGYLALINGVITADELRLDLITMPDTDMRLQCLFWLEKNYGKDKKITVEQVFERWQ